MKTNACMLLRVMCEWCIGLYHKDDLKMKTIRISCNLCFHIHRVTSSFMRMSTDGYTMMMIFIMLDMTFGRLLTSGCRLWTASPTMMGLGGVNCQEIHARMCGSCVGKYYAPNFILIGGHPYDGFNERSLIISCMYLHSLTPIIKSLTKYFLKY